jgi:hypothetical protein
MVLPVSFPAHAKSKLVRFRTSLVVGWSSEFCFFGEATIHVAQGMRRQSVSSPSSGQAEGGYVLLRRPHRAVFRVRIFVFPWTGTVACIGLRRRPPVGIGVIGTGAQFRLALRLWKMSACRHFDQKANKNGSTNTLTPYFVGARRRKFDDRNLMHVCSRVFRSLGRVYRTRISNPCDLNKYKAASVPQESWGGAKQSRDPRGRIEVMRLGEQFVERREFIKSLALACTVPV